MSLTRRQCLAGLGLLLPAAGASSESDIESLDTAIARLTDHAELIDSEALVLSVPSVAVNAAVVPVRVASALSDTRWLHLYADRHAEAWLGSLEVLPGSVPVFATHVRLERPCTLVGIAQTANAWYRQQTPLRALLAGCVHEERQP